MANLQNTEGFYLGSELVNTGTTKEGKGWTLYKAKFKPDMDTDKAFSFSLFDPLTAKNTKQMKDMIPGQQYKILYAEKPYTNRDGDERVGKTLIGIYSPTNGTSNTPQTAQKGSLMPDLNHFDDFKGKYIELAKKQGITPSPMHMMGAYMNHVHKNEMAILLAKCKEALR